MSSLGSSFVNKSGKKVAPKGAARRRPAPAATPAPTQPPASTSASPSRSVSVSNDAQPSALSSEVALTTIAENDGSVTLSTVTTSSIANEIVRSVQPNSTPAHSDAVVATEATVVPSSSVERNAQQDRAASNSSQDLTSVGNQQSTVGENRAPSAQADAASTADAVRVEINVPRSGDPDVSVVPAIPPTQAPIIFDSSAPQTSTDVDNSSLTPVPTSGTTRQATAAKSHTRQQAKQTSLEGPLIVQYEVPPPSTRRRKPAKEPPSNAPANSERKAKAVVADEAEPAAHESETNDDLQTPSVVTVAPVVEDSSKKRKARKDQGQPRKKAKTSSTANGTAEPEQDEAEPLPEPSTQATSASKSSRMTNAEKRRQRKLEKAEALGLATAQRQAAGEEPPVPQPPGGGVIMSIETPATLVTKKPRRTKTSRSRTVENAENEEPSEFVVDGDGEPIEATVPRPRQRRETPDGAEAVTIVPGVVTMYELAQRNLRTGWKSEREKLMAQIDWGEVKRRRKAEERAFAMNRGRVPSQSPEPEGQNGDNEEDDDDLDAALERAVGRSRKKQRMIQIKIVDGQHVIDETSMVVDRHAMANDAEILEEVEEDDLTKQFNSQTHMCLRRKEPEERIRNWDRWTDELTDQFYDCLSRFGTDFMIISKMFKGRTRREVKAKFVREERLDPDRVRDALNGARSGGDECWDVEEFMLRAGLADHEMKDPQELEAELAALRKEREKEIEEARKKAAEEKRQKKLAGAASDDEDDAGAARKKGKKSKKQKGNMGGGEEVEILEEYVE